MIESAGGPKNPRKSKEIESKESINIKWSEKSIASERHPDVNEDTILVDQKQKLFGVFDGMGGHSAGDIASRLAKGVVEKNVTKAKRNLSLDDIENLLRVSIEKANKEILEDAENHQEREGMGATAVVLKIHRDKNGSNFAIVANVGDSRAYKFNQGVLEQITTDDDSIKVNSTLTPEQKKRISEKLAEAKRPEDLSEEEMYYFGKRNRISKFVGGSYSNPSIYKVPAQQGDYFILTSDGIHDNLATGEITRILGKGSSPEVIAKTLVEEALKRSRSSRAEEMRAKPDDMSVVVIEVA